jgi:inosine-uridine nucleoside N-ribohydrolase
MPTFNLAGDPNAGIMFLSGNIGQRQMVGKNICHTVLFSRDIWSNNLCHKSNNPAHTLFCKAADLYFKKHKSKKFHDPTAAVCHLYPEIAQWFRGNTVKVKEGWTTNKNLDGDYILADIDRDQLWSKLFFCNS